MAVSIHHTVLALPCFLQPSRTFPWWLLNPCLLVCSQKPSVVNSKHANWTGFKNKSLQMSSIHYCYNCKLHFSRKIHLNSQDCGHFSCCNACQPDGTRQDSSHQANENCWLGHSKAALWSGNSRNTVLSRQSWWKGTCMFCVVLAIVPGVKHTCVQCLSQLSKQNTQNQIFSIQDFLTYNLWFVI